jgi:hypothetical protein
MATVSRLVRESFGTLHIRLRYPNRVTIRSASTSPLNAMEAIKSTIAENFGGVAHAVASKDQQFSLEKDVPDLSGKVALITG